MKRYNAFNLQTNCRICFTQTRSKRTPLKAPLKRKQEPVLSVHEALEIVTGEKIPLGVKYPESVCGVCLELLKITYDLVVQYHVSKQKLKAELRKLGENYCEGESRSEDDEVEKPPKAPVEIFMGSKKLKLNDLLIVDEETDDEDRSFEGFLQNLGKTVTASFVRKNPETPQADYPIIENESLDLEPPPTSVDSEVVLDLESNTVTAVQANNSVQSGDQKYTDKPANAEVFANLLELNETDRELVNSALKLNYKCPYCSKPLASMARAKMHSRMCYKNTANVTCYVCKAKFKSRRYLLKHFNDVHFSKGKRLQNTAREKHCTLCGKLFQNAGSLFSHMKRHEERQHVCDICGKQFHTKTQLRVHSQSHNRHKTVVVCPICGKSFHYQTGLFYHMKTHTNERNIQCSYCPKRFYSRTSVKRHELTHTGMRPYGCQFCDRKFRSTCETKKHELLHTGNRPFKCVHCNMGFIQAHNLKVHLMTHPGDFFCTVCPKSFVSIDVLRFHMKSKHKMELNFTLNEDNEAELNSNQLEIGQSDQIFSDYQLELSDVSEAIQLEDGSFFISGQYEMAQDQVPSDDLVVRTFEFRDNVLVETTPNLT
uniref:Protein krueppel n=1 Tax=Dendroctonus ponderosae TaxID=77166 RepID=A0AAR5Q5D3_DENPD